MAPTRIIGEDSIDTATLIIIIKELIDGIDIPMEKDMEKDMKTLNGIQEEDIFGLVTS